MDDQRFDDTIKNKVGNYEDPEFDPSALAAMHHQMATALVLPWYSLYRTELLFGSGFIASTLIILWSQWFMSTTVTETLNEKITQLQTQQFQIDKLQNEISSLKNSSRDTIRIIEIREQPSSSYTSLLYRIRLLETDAANRIATNERSNDSENSFETSNQGGPYYVAPAFGFRTSISSRLSPRSLERESVHAESDNDTTLTTATTSQYLSAKMLRNLEKYYHKGVGIRLGPIIEMANGNYSVGESDLSITYGILGDFILSPSFSVEAGIKHSKRYYEISDNYSLITSPLPGVDESLGTLQKAEIDSWMFEFPIAFKYRYPLSLKTHLQSGIGYSTLLYHRQIFEYDYSFTGGGDAFTLGSVYELNDEYFYTGSLNLSLGISHQLKNKKLLETSLYYQYGIGEKGVEKINANFLGIRGIYWFTIR